MAHKLGSPLQWANLAFKATPTRTAPLASPSAFSRQLSTSTLTRSMAISVSHSVTSSPNSPSRSASGPFSPPPRSTLQHSLAAARLRVRYASTDTSKPAPAARAVASSGSAGAEPAEVAGAEPKEEAAPKADKIKLSEVRRLANLARPEAKTIGIAISLASQQAPSQPSQTPILRRLTLFFFCIGVHSWLCHRQFHSHSHS